ncbi:MAG: PEP-utilizing enzyme [Rhodospirillales bacterium]|nr:PEP-utilizing enzyme [Rhodospirillales bacterium]
MIDRSISALRTLRPDFDKNIFWFRDDLHQPYPISPMGMTTVQKHHAWGYHVASDQTQLPPSKGAHVKIHKGRVYLGFALINDEAEVGQRAESFGKLVEYCIDNWDEYYQKYIDEIVANIDALELDKADSLSTPELLENLKKSEQMNRRAWEIHFILMYPADALYLEFEAYCKELGIEEKDFVTLLKGFDSMPAKTDEELWNLAKIADANGLREIFVDTPADSLQQELENRPEGKDWLEQLSKFLDVYGNRISAAHLDVLFSTWKEDPKPVLETIQSYFPRMEDGWDFFDARGEVDRQREAAIENCKKEVKQKDQAGFQRFLKAAQRIYAYQEDHGFYIDQGCTAALHYSLMACGRRLQSFGLLENADEVFFLNYSELVEVLDDLARSEKIGTYHHQVLVPPLIEERRKDWATVTEQDAPLTIGAVPETMTDPIAIKVFGIIDEILHPKGEKEVVEKMEGFPGAPGQVEGPARVVMNFEDFPTLQAGEILVCPYTGTAWTPLFLKIGGVVTDTGGMLTHAAIAAREYGIPAVVGTWNATNSIRNGDIIRLDGDSGVVEIIKRVT